MSELAKRTPQMPVVLASLLLWASFAWGLPDESPAAEGEAEAAVEDPWAGVKVSDAYDYAKCPRCGNKNEIRRPACSRCEYSLPQPSGEYTYPPWVFVPGKGFYREGTVVEPGNKKKGMLTAGLVLAGSGLAAFTVACILGAESDTGEPGALPILGIGGLGAAIAGGVLLIVALATRTEPVYAGASGERFEPYERPAFTRRAPRSDGAALKVEVTVLSF